MSLILMEMSQTGATCSASEPKSHYLIFTINHVNPWDDWNRNFIYFCVLFGVYCSTGTAMNPHESENYLPISRSFSASKWCRDFLGRDISGTTFLRIESSLIQSNSRDLATAICTHVSKDTGSNSCERKIFRPSVHYFFFDISLA